VITNSQTIRSSRRVKEKQQQDRPSYVRRPRMEMSRAGHQGMYARRDGSQCSECSSSAASCSRTAGHAAQPPGGEQAGWARGTSSRLDPQPVRRRQGPKDVFMRHSGSPTWWTWTTCTLFAVTCAFMRGPRGVPVPQVGLSWNRGGVMHSGKFFFLFSFT